MPVSHKKVILRRFGRDLISGYLSPANFIREGLVELLDLAGKLVALPVAEVKWICFVRDFQPGDLNQPEKLARKTFITRPRTQGLWVRLRLQDNDCLEGMVQNDVSLLEAGGLFLSPPDSRSNTQRIFVPRQAMLELDVLAVIKTAARRGSSESAQESLFTPGNSAG